jgi:Leucine-rich repeat (LRR) protein
MRLDLGFNRLSSLPPEIAQLPALEQLWLNNNPFLDALPPQIELCKKLKVKS